MRRTTKKNWWKKLLQPNEIEVGEIKIGCKRKGKMNGKSGRKENNTSLWSMNV